MLPGITALGDHELTSKQARDLLSDWIEQRNSPNLRRISIEAYSLYVGLKFPDDSLGKFLEVIQSTDVDFYSDILHSLVVFFEVSSSVPGNQLIILKHLKMWLQFGKRESPHLIAALAVWRIMQTSETSVTNLASEKLSTLFWLSKNDQEVARVVSSLIAFSLNLKLTRFLILKELKLWFYCVDRDTELRQTLGKIIIRATKLGDSRERLRITDYLNRWAIQGNSYALTLLAYLQDKGLTK